MKKVLTRLFFNRPAEIVAQELLGKFIISDCGKGEISLMINEVEAYTGPDDLACHASRGKTDRTSVMFGPAGIFYVYFVYGIHWMLNVVTGRKGFPAAVLLRGAGKMRGPARLTKFLKIDKKFNGKSAKPVNGLWFEDRGVRIKPEQIKRTPRIGVSYAGPMWSKKPQRYLVNFARPKGR